MLDGAKAALRSLHQQYSRLDAVAENFANVDTPGYRSTRAGQRNGEFSSWMEQHQGALKPGEGPLDMAMPTGGFLEVQTSEGNAFTRRGDLRVDDNHHLVTGAGDLVLDAEHKAITCPDGALKLSVKGEVYQGERLVARLGRYQLDTPVPVPGERQTGGSLQLASGPVRVDGREINVGQLELSNVDAHREQTEQLDLQARARMLADAMQVSDKASEAAIRDIARSR